MKTENWKKVRLGDILLIQKKSKIKASDGIENGIYPFFTCSNDIVRTYNSAQYKGPALIFGTGGKASVHFCDTEFSTSTDCLTYYPVSSEINLDLVNQYIQSNIYLLENGFKGAGLKHVSRDYIANIEINLPDIKTQDYIVQKLNKAKNIISNSKKLLTKYDLLIKSRFIEMFGDPVLNPMGWEEVKITELCKNPDDIKCGPFGTQLSKDEYQKDGVPVFGIPQINSSFRVLPIDFLANSKAEKLDAYSLICGDIAMSRKGNVGKCAIYSGKEKGIIHSDVVRLRVDNTVCNSIYLMNQLHISPKVETQISNVSSGAIMAGINVTKMKNIIVYNPPLSLQNDFAAFVQQIDKSKFTVQKSLEKAETLYKSLMQEYFA